MELICGKVKGSGILDYVTGWYFKAAEYVQGTPIIVGFVRRIQYRRENKSEFFGMNCFRNII